MKNSKPNKTKNEALLMSMIYLSSNQCSECGKCCFNCEYLDVEDGCTNHSFRLSTRCASFPILFGSPTLMGHRDNKPSDRLSNDNVKEKVWFVYDYPGCILQQNEVIFNNLRWILDDINSGNEISFFFVQHDKSELYLEKEQ